VDVISLEQAGFWFQNIGEVNGVSARAFMGAIFGSLEVG
jgi:hypothetical protein